MQHPIIVFITTFSRRSFPPAIVHVGFESPVYNTTEGLGFVEVCATVIDSNITNQFFTVELFTETYSATGECLILYLNASMSVHECIYVT